MEQNYAVEERVAKLLENGRAYTVKQIASQVKAAKSTVQLALYRIGATHVPATSPKRWTTNPHPSAAPIVVENVVAETEMLTHEALARHLDNDYRGWVSLDDNKLDEILAVTSTLQSVRAQRPDWKEYLANLSDEVARREVGV